MTPKEVGFYPRVAVTVITRLGDTDLIAYTRNAVVMTGEAVAIYPEPKPSLATITTSVDSFETSVHDALDGGKVAIMTRKQARNDLLDLLRPFAAYVTGNCQNSVLNLLKSGLDPVRAPGPVSQPLPPGNLRLEYTDVAGELLLKFDRVSNANSYSVEVATSPDGPWTHDSVSTQSRTIIDGLKAGTVYWVRVCANGSAGPSGYGGPVTAMAV